MPSNPPPGRPLHVVWTLSNDSTAPYFNWFAEAVQPLPEVRLTVLNLFHEQPQMLEDMARRGAECRWFRYHPARRKTALPQAAAWMWQQFRQLKPDVVHAHLFDDALPAMLAARLAGVPMRAITKGDAGYHHRFAPRWVWADRLNNRNATHVLPISRENQHVVHTVERCPAHKLYLTPHGLPVDLVTRQTEAQRAKLRQQLGLQGRQVFGTVARLIPWKGYRTIVEAARLLVPHHPQALFLFTGRGEQKAELEGLIAEYGLQDHVRFTGWIDPDDIPALYGVMDAYVHAAELEPFGLVLAEAMLNGAPVVSTPTGAAADAIRQGETGYLFPVGDAQSLANALHHLLNNPTQAAQVAQAGQAEARQRFNLQRMVDDHLALYRGQRQPTPTAPESTFSVAPWPAPEGVTF